MSKLEVLDHIHTYLHWCIFPINQNTDKPILKGWPDLASNDPQQIHHWFKQYPGCNWGVATGIRSGIFVVDVDTKEKKDGKLWLEGLKADGRALPPTLTVQTPHDGL